MWSLPRVGQGRGWRTTPGPEAQRGLTGQVGVSFQSQEEAGPLQRPECEGAQAGTAEL